MRYLKTTLASAAVLIGTILLAGCASQPRPEVHFTFSRTRPLYLVPMVTVMPEYPSLAIRHGILHCEVTACFKVDRQARLKDIRITQVSTPSTGTSSLDLNIRRKLADAVLQTLHYNMFFPEKNHGKRVESPQVCEDFRFDVSKSAGNAVPDQPPPGGGGGGGGV